MAYAEGTSVDPSRTRAELETLIEKHGATSYGWGKEGRRAQVYFAMRDRKVMFRVELPDERDTAVVKTASGRPRAFDSRGKALEQETKRRWRALLLVVKAKLESVESGIETFDQAFLPHFVMADGRTLSDALVPELATVLNGDPARMLPAAREVVDAEIVAEAES